MGVLSEKECNEVLERAKQIDKDTIDLINTIDHLRKAIAAQALLTFHSHKKEVADLRKKVGELEEHLSYGNDRSIKEDDEFVTCGLKEQTDE